MSIDSALIVRKDSLPTTAELAAAIAESGVTVLFPEDFRLDSNVDGWLPVIVDGEQSGFEYGVAALADVAETLPAKARKHGDTLLSFAARGALSAETASLIQRAMAQRWNAAGWIEDELISPDDLARYGQLTGEMDPAVAALMQGLPAERGAAMDAYVARHYPPAAALRPDGLMEALKPLIIPAMIFVIFAAIYFWTRQT